MQRYWTDFATDASPGGRGVPRWPAWTSAREQMERLVPPTPSVFTDFAQEHHCALFTPGV